MNDIHEWREQGSRWPDIPLDVKLAICFIAFGILALLAP